MFQPAARRALQRGIHQIVEAVRPTLGPRARTVASASLLGDHKAPELLEDGGLVARRIIGIPDPDENMGAMLVRNLLWRVHEQVGDGTATAAVLFRAVFDRGLRYVAAGGNAMQLRRTLAEDGLRAVLSALGGMARPVHGKAQLARLAESICGDRELARMLGEIFDILGPYGHLEIEAGRSRQVEREYAEGIVWRTSLLSRHLTTDAASPIARLENPLVLVSDAEVDDPAALLPALELAIQSRASGLVLVAGKLSDNAVGLLVANRAKLKVIAVKSPGMGSEEQADALADLAVLTGGRAFLRAAGDSLARVQAGDLGRVRRAWAERTSFGVVGGGGDPRALRRHIADLRAAFQVADDAAERTRLQQRIGKLLGGSATLRVGGATETEVNVRKALAQRSADALRAAVGGGVVPGGGTALLACRPAVQRLLDRTDDPDARAAYRLLIEALAEPARAILANAGEEPGRRLGEAERTGPGFGFDVVSGQVVNMAEAGILDALAVQRAVAHAAISSAALALTVEALVHRRVLTRSFEP